VSPILDRERVLSDSVNLTFNLNHPPPGTSVRLCEGGVKPPHSKAGRANVQTPGHGFSLASPVPKHAGKGGGFSR